MADWYEQVSILLVGLESTATRYSDWLLHHYQWIFSGIGVFILPKLLSWIPWRWKSKSTESDPPKQLLGLIQTPTDAERMKFDPERRQLETKIRAECGDEPIKKVDECSYPFGLAIVLVAYLLLSYFLGFPPFKN